MEAPGLKLKDEAFGFNPPLVGAGDGCCCEGSKSSLSSQLIVSSSTQSLVEMVLPLWWRCRAVTSILFGTRISQ